MSNCGLNEFCERVRETAASIVTVDVGMFMQENRERAREIFTEHGCREENVDALVRSAGLQCTQNCLGVSDAVANVLSPEILYENRSKIPQGLIEDVHAALFSTTGDSRSLLLLVYGLVMPLLDLRCGTWHTESGKVGWKLSTAFRFPFGLNPV